MWNQDQNSFKFYAPGAEGGTSSQTIIHCLIKKIMKMLLHINNYGYPFAASPTSDDPVLLRKSLPNYKLRSIITGDAPISTIRGIGANSLGHFEAFTSADFSKTIVVCNSSDHKTLYCNFGKISLVTQSDDSMTPSISWNNAVSSSGDYQVFSSSVSFDFSKIAVMFRDPSGDYYVQLGTINW